MYIFIYQKTNGKSFRRGTVICVGDVRNTPADREAGYDWCGGLIEVACYREGFGLLSWCERSFYEETLGVRYETLVRCEFS